MNAELNQNEVSEKAEEMGAQITREWQKIDRHGKASRGALVVGFFIVLLAILVLSQMFFSRWDETIDLVDASQTEEQARYDQQAEVIKSQLHRLNTLRAINSKLSVHVAVSANAHENLRRSTNALLDDKEAVQAMPERHRAALIRANNQAKAAISKNATFWEVHSLMTSTETASSSTP